MRKQSQRGEARPTKQKAGEVSDRNVAESRVQGPDGPLWPPGRCRPSHTLPSHRCPNTQVLLSNPNLKSLCCLRVRSLKNTGPSCGVSGAVGLFSVPIKEQTPGGGV